MPPPGWYEDPSGRHAWRYWDGREWTGHVSGGAPRTPAIPTHPAALDHVRLAGLGPRLGAYLLDWVISLATLVVGWLVWCCFTFRTGQTPAKKLLGHRVVLTDSGRSARFGDMFLRNVVLQFGLLAVSVFTFGIPWLVASLMVFAGELHQTAWDRMAGTVVVLDPRGVTLGVHG